MNRQMNYTIIDAHAHIFPSKIAEKATSAIGKFYDIEMDYIGSPEQLIKSGKNIQVSKYLVCSTATKPEQAESINNFIAEEINKHCEFIGLGTIHPLMENIYEEIDRIKELGLKGIKLHPDFQNFNIDDEKMIPIYKYIGADFPVLFHTGDDRYDYSSPRRLRAVLERCPDLTAIAAHFGGYTQWDEALEYLNCENVYFDTSSTLFTLEKEKAIDMIHTLSEDKFMFGTDFPMWKHEEELERFLNLDLGESTNKKILCENFVRLFKICL